MAFSSTDRAYFLGNVSAEEATRIELAVMEDAAVAERLEAAEAELIDDYVDGVLPLEERQRFETVFMAVPGRASRVRVAAELLRRATDAAEARPAAPSRPSGRLRLLLPLAAMLLLGVGLWFGRGPRPVPQNVAVVPSPPPVVPSVAAPTPSPIVAAESSPTPSFLRRASFVLAMGVTRSESAQQFRAPRGVDVIDFEIDLEGETRFSTFQARLTDASGREMWRSSGESPLKAENEGVLVVSVPVSSGIVAAPRSELEILGRAATGPVSLARIAISFKP